MLSEKEKEEILNEEKESRDRQRYTQLKQQLSNNQRVENGNLIIVNQNEHDAITREIKELEERHPGLNFFKA